MQLLQQQLQGGGALDPHILALCQQVSQLQVTSPSACKPPTAGSEQCSTTLQACMVALHACEVNCTARNLGMRCGPSCG